MLQNKNRIILIFIFFATNILSANNLDLEKLFLNHNINGTIIISSLDGKIEYIYNKDRSEQRFLPASTFKIPNTLIALEEEVITNEKDIIKWDGKDKGWDLWNKDQSIETAFPISCVWFYQKLAERIGNTKYLGYLNTLNYGNKMTGSDITTFWLEGDLRISAREQISFLKKLFNNQLPFKTEYINILKNIMIVETTPNHTIRAKTGWAMRVKNQIGWYVGYVETKEQVWFFATNLDINNKNDAIYRKQITMEALKATNIILNNK